MNNEGVLACHGYEFERDPSDHERSPFIAGEEQLLYYFNVKNYYFLIQKLDSK